MFKFLLACIALSVLFCKGASAATLEATIVLPANFDFRTQNLSCTSSVFSQGQCGSCWAVSAATALSDRQCLFGNTDINGVSDVMLSPQDPLQCVTSLSNGCSGGYMVAAWRYLAQRGAATCTGGCRQGCWPYVSSACTPSKDKNNNGCVSCPAQPACANGQQMFRWNAGTYGQITAHSGLTQEVAMMLEIFQNGPVQTCFTVYDSFYSFFRSNPTGILTTATGTNLGGHCVKILGWGTENGVKYWLAANSWGPNWGDGGYFKYLRGSNLAGFESWVYGGCPAESPKPCTLTFPITGTATQEGAVTQQENNAHKGIESGGWTAVECNNPLVKDAVDKAVADAQAKLPEASGKVVRCKAVYVQPVSGLNIRVQLAVGTRMAKRGVEIDDVDDIEVLAYQTLEDGNTQIVA